MMNLNMVRGSNGSKRCAKSLLNQFRHKQQHQRSRHFSSSFLASSFRERQRVDPNNKISSFPSSSSFSTSTNNTNNINTSNNGNDNLQQGGAGAGGGDRGFFGKLWDRYSVQGQQRRIEMGERLFRAAQWRAMNQNWYGDNKVPIAFKSQHAMISMHIWFLHKRLLASSTSPSHNSSFNLLVDEELFESFWNDTKSRIRAVDGVHELTVNKHLKNAQQMTFLQCTHYDHAFDLLTGGDGDDSDGEGGGEGLRHDPKERFEIVCDAVWKHVLGGEEDASEELIKRLGAYVEYQFENIILRLPDDYFDEGRVDWGCMPSLDYDGDYRGDGAVQDARGRGLEFMDMEKKWVKVLTDAGNPYYWNTKTNETSWEHK